MDNEFTPVVERSGTEDEPKFLVKVGSGDRERELSSCGRGLCQEHTASDLAN